jgi:ribosomal protein L40E
MHVGPLPLPLIIFILAVILFLLVTSRASDERPRKDPRACFDCGATHPSHANFCRRCGRRLS